MRETHLVSIVSVVYVRAREFQKERCFNKTGHPADKYLNLDRKGENIHHSIICKAYWVAIRNPLFLYVPY